MRYRSISSPAFAIVFLKERFAWNYAAAFVCLGAAAFFAFGFRNAPVG
jgi:uncharacterized protein (DUF486 family)